MGEIENITLRPFRRSDVEAFMGWAGDEKVTRYCRWDTFKSKEDATKFLDQVIASHPWYMAICLHDVDLPVGSIYVLPGENDKDTRRGEIGYALSADYWGKGIATQAVNMAMSRVFKELQWLDRVEGLVFEENKASQKVMEKAGFVREGILRNYFFVKGKSRDIVVYSIINTHTTAIV